MAFFKRSTSVVPQPAPAPAPSSGSIASRMGTAGSEMVGKATKAFALGKGSTGIVVQDNEIGPDYNREVGFDDPSAQEGYNGPEAY